MAGNMHPYAARLLIERKLIGYMQVRILSGVPLYNMMENDDG